MNKIVDTIVKDVEDSAAGLANKDKRTRMAVVESFNGVRRFGANEWELYVSGTSVRVDTPGMVSFLRRLWE